MKILISILLLFTFFKDTPNKQKLTIGKWQLEIPATWKIKGNSVADVNTYKIVANSDIIVYDTSYFNPWLCPHLKENYLINSIDSLTAYKNNEVNAYNLKIKSDYADCFNTRLENLSVNSYKFIIATAYHNSDGVTGLYHQPEDNTNFFNFWGRNLSDQTRNELLEAIKSLKRID